MTLLDAAPPNLLAALQASSKPRWIELWPLFETLDERACAEIEPLCARFSDDERQVPLSCRQSLIAGAPPSPALRLCRTLNWSNFSNERTQPGQDPEDLFSPLLGLPVFEKITKLAIADEARYLKTEALDCFSALKELRICTREAFTSALRDTQCAVVGRSKALQNLETLTLGQCNITERGLAAILRSPHLGPITSLELYVPARAVLIGELSRAIGVIRKLTFLGLAADGLSEPGVKKLVAARESLRQLRVLRIVAGETGGFDWELPFNRHDGAKNVRQLAKALTTLLPALDGLERVEIVHHLGNEPHITTKETLLTLTQPKEILATVLPASMR